MPPYLMVSLIDCIIISHNQRAQVACGLTCHERHGSHGLLDCDLCDWGQVEVSVVRHDNSTEQHRHYPWRRRGEEETRRREGGGRGIEKG